jgi:hypothetical protein
MLKVRRYCPILMGANPFRMQTDSSMDWGARQTLDIYDAVRYNLNSYDAVRHETARPDGRQILWQ